MNKELKKMTEQWMSLERETLEQRKKAEQYYDENLMSLIEEDSISRSEIIVF